MGASCVGAGVDERQWSDAGYCSARGADGGLWELERNRKLEEFQVQTGQELASNAATQSAVGSAVGSEWTGRQCKLAVATRTCATDSEVRLCCII